jgi:hypothetical protein
MAAGWLQARRDYLLEVQNADGGWGYVRGGRSWLEPTALAMLALEGERAAGPALERAWRLVRSWQRRDGAWQAAAEVDVAHWTTALAVLLHSVRGVRDGGFDRGVEWLVGTKGAEGTWVKRLLHRARPELYSYDPAILGWPWLPGTGSWVEPTAHALMALRAAAPRVAERGGRQWRKLEARVKLAERMLVERSAVDGGWNYGNRIVLGETLPSYPETTAVALLAMRDSPDFDPERALQTALGHWRGTTSPLARAWLGICLRNYGIGPPENGSPAAGPPGYNHVAALEALAAEEGNYRLFCAGSPR